MFLYPDSMVDGNAHTESLREFAETQLVDALDCWIWSPHVKEELEILKNCGKQINYNIGERYGEEPPFFAAADPKERRYALDFLRRETDYALELNSKKIVFGSGRDVLENREDAIKRFEDLVLEWAESMPKDVWLTLEPTDSDIHKCYLFGDMNETCKTIQNIRKNGFERIGILLDMGHIPLMYETLESAVEKSGELLEHIHLGNCIVKDPKHPLYGDKHPCWGEVGGEYDEKDGEKFLEILKKSGYFLKDAPQTVTFETRVLTGMTPTQTIEYLVKWFWNTCNIL